MEVEFGDADSNRLWGDARFDGGFDRDVVKAYRKAMAIVLAATDERDFRNHKGLHYEKLTGRDHQRSMRLTRKWRLIVEVIDGVTKIVRILEISNHYDD